MSSKCAPGSEKFVYHYAVTLPLVFFLGSVYFLLGKVLKRAQKQGRR